jgi:hypothetical protein
MQQDRRFDPLAANETGEDRELNCRIEIVVQTNPSDLPPLDDTTATTAATQPKK